MLICVSFPRSNHPFGAFETFGTIFVFLLCYCLAHHSHSHDLEFHFGVKMGSFCFVLHFLELELVLESVTLHSLKFWFHRQTY